MLAGWMIGKEEKKKLKIREEEGSENKFMEQEEKERRQGQEERQKKEQKEREEKITTKEEGNSGASPHTLNSGNETEKGKSKGRQKAKKKAVITERDIAIMQEINRHGFMGAEEISRTFKMANMTAYKRLEKLQETGLIKHARILYAYPGVYWLTFAGKGTCKSGLSTISTISAATFEHDMRLLRLSLDLKAKYGERLREWRTPRELRAQKYNIYEDKESGFKAMKSHTPDALIVMDAGGGAALTKIALELELSPKSTPRLKGIVESYAIALRRGRINRVVYYCSSEAIKRRVKEHIERSDTAS
jgi:DNA-binding Lrp family transcriptional regulator